MPACRIRSAGPVTTLFSPALAVLVVADQDRRVVRARECAHAVEDARRGLTVLHRLSLPRNHLVVERGGQPQVAFQHQRPVPHDSRRAFARSHARAERVQRSEKYRSAREGGAVKERSSIHGLPSLRAGRCARPVQHPLWYNGGVTQA